MLLWATRPPRALGATKHPNPPEDNIDLRRRGAGSADGTGRPNTAIYVFDQTGRLVLTSRDSNIADDRPGPTTGYHASHSARVSTQRIGAIRLSTKTAGSRGSASTANAMP